MVLVFNNNTTTGSAASHQSKLYTEADKRRYVNNLGTSSSPFDIPREFIESADRLRELAGDVVDEKVAKICRNFPDLSAYCAEGTLRAWAAEKVLSDEGGSQEYVKRYNEQRPGLNVRVSAVISRLGGNETEGSVEAAVALAMGLEGYEKAGPCVEASGTSRVCLSRYSLGNYEPSFEQFMKATKSAEGTNKSNTDALNTSQAGTGPTPSI